MQASKNSSNYSFWLALAGVLVFLGALVVVVEYLFNATKVAPDTIRPGAFFHPSSKQDMTPHGSTQTEVHREDKPASEPPTKMDAVSAEPLPSVKAVEVEKSQKTLPSKHKNNLRDDAWIRQQKASHYALQLAGGRDRKRIEALLQAHPLSQPNAIFERSVDGKPWYSLLAGSYPSLQKAQASRGDFPPVYHANKAWPRNFGSVHKQLGFK